MKQINRTARIIINSSVDQVFPLFSALGEKKWVPGWKPEFIHPLDGEFIENMVFRTSSNNDTEKHFNWITTYLNNSEHLVIYTVFTENRVWTVRVLCTENNEGRSTAQVTYTYTGLNDAGDILNKNALKDMFRHDLKDWEEAINYYLKTGNKINVD